MQVLTEQKYIALQNTVPPPTGLSQSITVLPQKWPILFRLGVKLYSLKALRLNAYIKQQCKMNTKKRKKTLM